jgi:spore germination protein YaaH
VVEDFGILPQRLPEGRYFASTNNVMVVAHFYSIQESLEAVVTAMKHHLYTCEMMDDTILNCTKITGNKPKPIFFIQGDQRL